MLQLPEGWKGIGSAGRGRVEEFVISGSVALGDEPLDKWGYALTLAGDAPGYYRSDSGALMIAWWDVNELEPV